jgi:hypothetical protein
VAVASARAGSKLAVAPSSIARGLVGFRPEPFVMMNTADQEPIRTG